MIYKRLPLEGLSNARDLGGYPAGVGVTQGNTFLRSEGTDRITEQDAAFLYDYGVRTVIDLRTQHEFAKGDPEHLKNTLAAAGIAHANLPFVPSVDGIEAISENTYIHMVETGAENIRPIFEYIGERLALGGILYNCFAGKDRTGMLSALLLLLCGVSEPDVVADYMVSSVYLKPLAKKYNIPDALIASAPEYMGEFLAYFNRIYASAEQFLRSIGVAGETVATIQEKFLRGPL